MAGYSGMMVELNGFFKVGVKITIWQQHAMHN